MAQRGQRYLGGLVWQIAQRVVRRGSEEDMVFAVLFHDLLFDGYRCDELRRAATKGGMEICDFDVLGGHPKIDGYIGTFYLIPTALLIDKPNQHSYLSDMTPSRCK